MAIIRTQIEFNSVDSVPRDVAVNVLHWQTGAALSTDLFDDIFGEISGFFNVETDDDAGVPNGFKLGAFLSPMVSRSGGGHHRVIFYDLADDPLVPLYERELSLVDPVGDTVPLPSELAACLTIEANPVLAVPIRRRRGRVYFGPLNTGVLGTRSISGEEYPSLSTEFRDGAARAMKRLSFAVDRIDANWSIYSRVNDAAYQVVKGWIDNEFDIQRRRGLTASVRTNYELPGTGPTSLP
jgi:hypothetical protein